MNGFQHGIKTEGLDRLTIEFSNKLHNEAIRQIHRNIKFTKDLLSNESVEIMKIIPSDCFKEIKEKTKQKCDVISNKMTTKHNDRLTAMLKPVNLQLNNQRKWLVNLTTKDIPQPVNNVIGLGPKFNLQTNTEDTPTTKIISKLEPMIQKLPQTQERIELRNRLCNILTNHKNARVRKTTMDTILQKPVEETKQFIEENSELVIVNADKGNVTVLMEKAEYSKKLETLLNDDKTYKKLDLDPTNRIEANCNAFIIRWKD